MDGVALAARLVLIPFVLLSQRLLVLSPFIREQIAGDPSSHARQKVHLDTPSPDVRRPATWRDRSGARGRAGGGGLRLVIGYFGAIYEGRPTALLEICDHLRGRGIRALVVFVGSFMPSLDDYEGRFRARIEQMTLEDRVIVTGYVESTLSCSRCSSASACSCSCFPRG